MDVIIIILLIAIGYGFGWIGAYGKGKKDGIRIEREERKINVYKEALKVFHVWRNEIGGVSLKGVGQNYEAWIEKKLSDLQNTGK